MTLADGRQLAYQAMGEPGHFPVLVLHGTPGSSRQLAEPDARLLRDNPAVRAAFLDDLSHPAPTAARAAARDFWLFARQWDVDIAGIAVPAHIWHGTQDRNVPVAHARAIAARCPQAQLHIVDGGGHMLLSHLGHIIASVTPRRG